MLAHRASRDAGIDALGAAMLVAAVAVTPVAIGQAAPAFGDPVALLAGIGVGVSSSVIPYVADQLAMARLPRATYALMVSLLPATATVVGLVVLTQVPSATDVAGIALVIAGVALHRAPPPGTPPASTPRPAARRSPPRRPSPAATPTRASSDSRARP